MENNKDNTRAPSPAPEELNQERSNQRNTTENRHTPENSSNIGDSELSCEAHANSRNNNNYEIGNAISGPSSERRIHTIGDHYQRPHTASVRERFNNRRNAAMSKRFTHSSFYCSRFRSAMNKRHSHFDDNDRNDHPYNFIKNPLIHRLRHAKKDRKRKRSGRKHRRHQDKDSTKN